MQTTLIQGRGVVCFFAVSRRSVGVNIRKGRCTVKKRVLAVLTCAVVAATSIVPAAADSGLVDVGVYAEEASRAEVEGLTAGAESSEPSSESSVPSDTSGVSGEDSSDASGSDSSGDASDTSSDVSTDPGDSSDTSVPGEGGEEDADALKEATVEAGVYKMVPYTASSLAVSTADGALVLANADDQKGIWYVFTKADDANGYRLSDEASGLYVSRDEEGKVVFAESAEDDASLWKLYTNENGYVLVSASDGMALAVSSDTAYGTEVAAAEYSDENAGLATFTLAAYQSDVTEVDAAVDAGYYRFVPASGSGIYMSVKDESRKADADIVLGTDTVEGSIFSVTPVGEGKYTLNAFTGNKMLAVSSGKLTTANAASSDVQRWYIRKSLSSDSLVYLVSCEDPKLVITVGSAAAGTAVSVAEASSLDSDRWTLEKTYDQIPLENGGSYSFISDLSSEMCIGIKNGSSSEGAYNRLVTFNQNPSNVFVLEYYGYSNIYRIKSFWSGYYMTARTKQEGSTIKLVSRLANNRQLWRIRAMGDGTYALVNLYNNNLVVDVKNDATAHNTLLKLQKYTDGKGQRFSVLKSSSDFQAVPKGSNLVITAGDSSNKYMEVKDGSSNDLTAAQLNSSTKLTRQLFTIEQDGTYFKIRSIATGKYLRAYNGKAVFRDAGTSDYQKWVITQEGSRYRIYNVGAQTYLTCVTSYANGSQLVLASKKTDGTQLFDIKHGETKAGWQQYNGSYRLYKSATEYYTNTNTTFNGKTVHLGSDGAIATGFFQYNGYYYYFKGTAGPEMTDARPYLSQLYPKTRKGYWKKDVKGPACKYRITVDRAEPCTVTVYTQYPGQSSYNVPVFSFLCSTGLPATPTYAGTRKMYHRSRWQTLMGPSYGQFGSKLYLQQSNGSFKATGQYFHSVACGQANDHNLSIAEYNFLGSKRSHGCVRLSVRNAYWIYNFVPNGTVVIVGDNLARPLNRIAQPYASGAVDPTDPAYTGNYGYTDNGAYYNAAGFH